MTQQEIIEDIKGRLRIPDNVRRITILMEKNRLITRGDYYTMEDIHVLKQANQQDFLTACQILYPNGLPAAYANADGDPNLKAANAAAGWNFAGEVINTAGGILGSIFGKTDNSADRVLEYQQQEAKRKQTMMYVIIGVIGVVALAGIIFAIVKSNKSSNIIMK